MLPHTLSQGFTSQTSVQLKRSLWFAPLNFAVLALMGENPPASWEYHERFGFFHLYSTGNDVAVPFKAIQSLVSLLLAWFIYSLPVQLLTFIWLARAELLLVQEGWVMRGMICVQYKYSLSVCGFVQKADGTCNTNFKTTKTQEQVLQVFVEFIEGNTTILVSVLFL